MWLASPLDVIEYGKTLGKGSYGHAMQCTIDGMSYFLAHIQYVAKKFLGNARSQFKSFAQEASIDLPHRGIVRAIVCTQQQRPLGAYIPILQWGDFR